jgi:16S rRNA (guanine966-N2)-methyltransferase
MRIVGGEWAGRNLASPAPRVRPTAEAVRNAWLTLLEPRLQGARVVDLFAGTGALGLEALSRGAAYADFVENGPGSLHALKANVAALRVTGRTRVFKKDAIPFVAALPAGAYNVALADPPYGSRMLELLVRQWLETAFAEVLTVEHAADHELPGDGRVYLFEESAVSFFPASSVPPQPKRPSTPIHGRRPPSTPRRRR